MKQFIVSSVLSVSLLVLSYSCKPTPDQAKHEENQNESPLTAVVLKAKAFTYANKPDSALLCLDKAIQQMTGEEKHRQVFELMIEKAGVFHIWQKMDSVAAVIDQSEKIFNTFFPHDKLARSAILYTRGRLYLTGYYLQPADSLLTIAIALRKSVTGEEDTLLGAYYNELGTIYYYKGNIDSAGILFSKALQLGLKRRNQADRELARYYHNNGLINKAKGNFNNAASYYQKCLDILQSIMDPNSPDFSLMHRNLAFLANNLGNLDEAMKHVLAGEENTIRNFGKNSVQYAMMLELKAQINYKQKNFEQAKTNYESALDYFLKTPQEYQRDINFICTGLGNLEMEVGNYKTARDYFSRAAVSNLKYFPQEAGDVIMSVAYSYELEGMLGKARQEYLHAIEVITKYFGSDYYMLGLGFQKLATLDAKMGNQSESIKHFKRAVEIYRLNFGEKSNHLAETYMHFGLMHLDFKDPATAMNYFQKAEIALIPSFQDTIYSVLPHDSLLEPDDQIVRLLQDKTEGFLGLARLEKDSARTVPLLNDALTHLDKCIELMEIQRNSILIEEDRLIFQDHISLLCRQASNLCYRIYSITSDEAYAAKSNIFTARRKMMVLQSLIIEAAAKRIQGIPEDLLNTEQEIRKEISNCQSTISSNLVVPLASEQLLKDLRKKKYMLFDKLDSLENIYHDAYPDYYRLKFDLSAQNTPGIRSLPDEAVIEYDLDSTRILACMVTDNHYKLISLPVDSIFFTTIHLFLKQISHPGNPDNIQVELSLFMHNGNYLYRSLLEPFMKDIGKRKINIIPDGLLALLPFESLPVSESETAPEDFSQVPYLVKKQAVRYSYSSSQMWKWSSGNRTAGHNVLAVAPGYVSNTADNKNPEYLPTLPNSMKEVHEVIDIMGGKMIVGEEATKENFFRKASHFPVIHLSMHTRVNTQDPERSDLLFYPGNQAGAVTTNDLYLLRLESQLVVLSACNTGSGRLVESEGILNLARGFLYAGAESMVLTLWNVSDYSSSKLISSFYQGLGDKQNKDISLQNAKLSMEFMADPVKAHPYHWAGYILVGNSAPLQSANTATIIVIATASLLLIVITAFRFLIRRRKLHF